MLSSGTIIIGNKILHGSDFPHTAIKVSMIYNNVGKGESLINEWGLSILIEKNDEYLLFDTGGKSEVLLENMRQLGIDIGSISKIVISHNHWDHVNGLAAFLNNENIKPKVYVPEYSLSDIHENFKGADIVGVDNSMQINDFVWSTGQLEGSYNGNPLYEQSVYVKDGNSVYLFTGCSHPGIVKIVEHTRRIIADEDIKLVAGGFHLGKHSEKQIYDISDKLKNLNIEKIAPSHCTGDLAMGIFQDEWGNDFINFDLSLHEVSI
jgi:7,8-dihydropterin-6-yl-methyl-4-(beta-D-ribofuranosyl)aminobenzene 5'-phosphate synthase